MCSGAARVPVTAGVKLAMEGPPGPVGLHFTFEGRSLRPKLGPLEPRMGSLRLNIDHCNHRPLKLAIVRSDMGTLKHVNCLFSLNFDSEGCST